MLDTLAWLLVVELLGAAAAPLAFLLLPGLQDRGLALSKPMGLLLLALPLWLVGALGLLPVTRGTVAGWALLLAAASVAVAWPRRRQMAAFLREQRGLLMAAEGAFLLAFALWALVRAASPEIAHTEQPMDFAFLNASYRATAYPPDDPWLRGHGISYYYLGYLAMALPGKLAGLPTGVLYNLALATLPAMAAAGVVGIVATMAARSGASHRARLAMGLGAFLLLGVASNLEGPLEMLRAWGLGTPGFWQAVGVKGLDGPAPQASLFPTDGWWWWRATRVIDTVVDGASLDYTIQEFPFFSLLLGDLHPHVMAIPFQLLALGSALGLVLDRERLSPGWLLRRWPLAAWTGLAVGALGFLNAWDLPLYLAVALGALVLKGQGEGWSPQGGPPAPAAATQAGGLRGAVALVLGRRPFPAVAGAAAAGGLVVATALVPYLPYYAGLSTQATGVLPVSGPATRPLHLFIVWGVFAVALAPYLVAEAARVWRGATWWRAVVALELAAAPLLLWLLSAPLFGMGDQVPGRLATSVPLLLAIALLLARALSRAAGGEAPAAFAPAILAAGGLLVMLPELFYVVDMFGTRMNTVFKLYYQAWVLLAVATPIAIYSWASALGGAGLWTRRMGLAWLGVLGLVLLGAAYYPAGVLASLEWRAGSATLDGTAYLARQEPGEHAAIRWLWENAPAGSGILEAVGDDYTDYGRVAAFTGLPTVLGWPGHQLQWRGSSTPQGSRAADVAAFYRGQDPAAAEALLGRYGIRYVVLGRREAARYGVTSLEGLGDLLEPVFSQDGFTIYGVRSGNAGH